MNNKGLLLLLLLLLLKKENETLFQPDTMTMGTDKSTFLETCYGRGEAPAF